MLYSASGKYINSKNQCNSHNNSDSYLKMFNHLENYAPYQEQTCIEYFNGSVTNNKNNKNNENNDKCLTYCGQQGRYLCLKPFIHSHDDVVNGKIVRTEYKPSCGHCVSRPDIYYVDKPLYDLISSNIPTKQQNYQ